MKRHSADFNTQRWEDFQHSVILDDVTSEQMFRNFRRFWRQFQSLPKDELLERGWLASPQNEMSLFAQLFFALNADRDNALFRKSPSADESRLAMWLSLLRARAEYICLTQNVPRFHGLTKNDLRAIARLSVDPKIIRHLPVKLATHGVILIYLRALTGMKVDGAAFRLRSGHMVIGMSFRFSRLDYFWFTLMHELAHLVLHGDILDKPVVVDVER
jgi:HTH-type transcriptional regulator / antitoxin HigA